MPRKRKHSDDEEGEEAEEVENGVSTGRAKRKAAVAARSKAKDAAAAASDEEEDFEDEEEEDDDDENDEDFEAEDAEEEEEEEAAEGEGAKEEEGEEGGEEDEDEDVDADAIKVDCVEAKLEEPTADVPGYVLTAAEGGKQKLEMWFSEEMSETVGEISESFFTHFENKKLPVLHITKYDVIEERPEIFQIDVLEAKYDKAYDIRKTESEEKEKEGEEKEKEKKDDPNLANNFHCLVRVDEVDKTWATQYFMPDED